jgi:hypothetical protein
MPPSSTTFFAHAETRISRDSHLVFTTLPAPTIASAQPCGDEVSEPFAHTRLIDPYSLLITLY